MELTSKRRQNPRWMTGDYRQRVGQRIRMARERKGWTQTELAREVGVADAQISRWETGRTMPRHEALEALAKALGTTAERFFYD